MPRLVSELVGLSIMYIPLSLPRKLARAMVPQIL